MLMALDKAVDQVFRGQSNVSIEMVLVIRTSASFFDRDLLSICEWNTNVNESHSIQDPYSLGHLHKAIRVVLVQEALAKRCGL
jgi:hypothetical protein